MHNRIPFVVNLLIAAFGIVTLADESPTQSPPRLQVNLRDGSHIVGVPRIQSIPIQTAYAKMDIPLKQLASLRIADDRETASVGLQTGDHLTGILNLNSMELQTIFGTVLLDAQQVTALHMWTAGLTHENLVLYYSFDWNDGDKVTDKSKSGIDGINTGAEWIPDGVVGGAYRFSEKTGYVRIPHNAALAFQDKDFSAAFWIRPDTFDMPDFDAATFLDFESGGWRGWMLRFRRTFPSVSLGGAGTERSVLNTPLGIHKWTFIAVTYSEKHNELRGYINGKLDMWQTTNLNLTKSPTDHGIGNNTENPSQGFHGDMDEVTVFSCAITEDEIALLYRRGAGKAQEDR